MKKIFLYILLTSIVTCAGASDYEKAKKHKLDILQAEANCNHLDLDIEVRRNEGQNISVEDRMKILKQARCFELFNEKSCAFLHLDIERNKQQNFAASIVKALSILSEAGCKNPYIR